MRRFLTALAALLVTLAALAPATVARAIEEGATSTVELAHGIAGDGRIITGLTAHRALALTFDDGPGPETMRLLDVLDEHHVHATFFLVARQLEHARGRATAREILRRGHSVGLHSYEHDDLTAMTPGALGLDLDRSEAVFVDVFGARPTLYRPPYGRHDDAVDATLASRGYTEVLWNITAGDGRDHTADGVATAFHAALDQQERMPHGQGGVIILHDTHRWIVDAVPAILADIDARNCDALANGEEMWDLHDDLSAWYEARGGAPAHRTARRMQMSSETFEARQARLRADAQSRCGI
jgi:peptidoglycan/xylan/chitin deacetylase (PgdA/CDA1 family)